MLFLKKLAIQSSRKQDIFSFSLYEMINNNGIKIDYGIRWSRLGQYKILFPQTKTNLSLCSRGRFLVCYVIPKWRDIMIVTWRHCDGSCGTNRFVPPFSLFPFVVRHPDKKRVHDRSLFRGSKTELPYLLYLICLVCFLFRGWTHARSFDLISLAPLYQRCTVAFVCEIHKQIKIVN